SGQYWNGSAWVWKSPPYVITDSQTYHANFIAPFVIDPNNADRLLGGGWSLWRTNDAKTTNTSSAGPTWATIKPPDGTSNPISAIAIAPGNSSLIWVGHNNGDVFVTANGTLITPTWTRVDTHTVALPNRFVTRLTIDPQDAQIVYATFGGFSPDNVWRTTNGGATWADLTGSGLTGLPDTPVRSLVVNPNHSNWLYVGTEVGIFASEDGGATWGVPQDGPANVSVDELFWLNNGTLVAATHGRGLYKADFGVALSAKSRHTEAPGNGNGALDPGETLAIQVGLTNGGAQTATGITGTLRLIAGSATALTGTVAYPNLNAGATQTNTTPFAFNINPEQACGEPLTFVLSATYNLTRTFAHTFSVPIGAPTLGVTATYTATDLPQAIPDYDPAGVNSSIVIAAPGAIGDVDARVVSVTHTWDSDLVFRLSHSSGAQAYLINQRGSNSDNFVNTLLDDSAATPIVSGTAPFTGRFRPEEPLSAFNGQPLSGTWTLNLSDQATGDTGILNSWALDIRPINYTCAIYLPTPTVQLSPNAITVGEGDGAATITATLSGAAAVTVTVDYATTNGTATAPADYAAASGTLTFTPGVTQAAFNVAIVNDALIENAETFGVTLSNPISATLGAPSSASVTISDNDQPGVALSSATYSANESAGVVPITVTLNQAAPYVVTVAYATSNGTAIAPGDYASATGTVTFTPGVTQSTFNVAIVNEALVENSEIFNVTLSNPSGATLGAPTSTTITIIDNDLPAVQFSSAAYAVAENSGSQPITVTLEQAAPFTVTVVYATSNGTATAPGDYVAATDTLTFTPGVTQLAFSVSIVNDALIENNETFSVTLSNPGSATLGSPASALVTIVDDDQPKIQFSAATYAASESSSTALITVTLDQPAAITVTVHFATSDGTATAGSDYTLTSGTLTIIPGLSAATFSVPILDDAQFEAPEALNLTLSAPINATLGALTQATLSISDNDFGLFLPLVIKE
ncbi:MAG TPA: Calx-beta domain-containing protein, partial [Anaerolineae bacterium]|nr:Calx-beta domain-containing protein [Anaerolineae bacterium]